MQSVTGDDEKEATLVLKDGNYSKEQMIDMINQELDRSGIADIRAKEYGESAIQLSGVDYIVTGLKGNMFKLETSGKIYTSVFYDNVKYGGVGGDPATIKGEAYYSSYNTTGYVIKPGVNDTLRVKLDGAGTYKEIKIAPSQSAGYSAQKLKDAINAGIRNAGLEKDLIIDSIYEYININGKDGFSGYYDYLVLKSKKTGEDISIEVDKADAVSKAAFDTLFVTTNFDYKIYPNKYTPYNTLFGEKHLMGPIEVGDNRKLSFSVDGTDYTVELPKSHYDSVNQLAVDLQDNFPLSLKDKLTVSVDANYCLRIAEKEPVTIGKIDAPKDSAAQELFHKLFDGESCNYLDKEDSGTIQYHQGSTSPEKIKQASVVMPYPIPSDSIQVTSYNNRFSFEMKETGDLYYSMKTITLTPRDKPYSKSEFIHEMNKQFKSSGYPVEASISSNGAFTLSTTYVPDGNNIDFDLRVCSGDNGYRNILIQLVGGVPENAHTNYSDTGASIQGEVEITDNFVIDEKNDTLSFSYDKKNITVKIPRKTYKNGEELAEAVEKAFEEYVDGEGNHVLKGKLKVSNKSQGINIEETGTRTGAKFSPGSCSGNFYNEVFIGKVVKHVDRDPEITEGTFEWEDGYAIGRQDVRNNTTKIIKGLNDEFIMDFNYPDDSGDMQALPLQVTIPEGDYDGDLLAETLKNLLNAQLQAKGADWKDFSIDAKVGGHTTGVVGNNDANALQFTLHYNTKTSLTKGEYYLDGVRGSSAFVLFYKSVGLPMEAYADGAVDISRGVDIKPGKNTFFFTTDGEQYEYTIPEGHYSAGELINKLNNMFQSPNASDLTAPVRAKLVNGVLELAQNSYGRHPITDIGGSAKSTIFYREEERGEQDKRMLQVGDKKGNDIELTRVVLNTNFLHINSAAISKPRYAEKALGSLDYALDYLNTQRAKWGVLNNRLEKSVAVDNLIAENTQSAESSIRDTDYAEELLKYSSSKILCQAGEAVLAHNRTSREKVMQLLKV